LTGCTFYTDGRDAFAKALPPGRHVAGKAHTTDIEHDNSNTRHHLGRFTRRTEAVSRKEFMADLTLRIWHAVTNTDLFFMTQRVALSIFR
jgi:IS1 family transposase